MPLKLQDIKHSKTEANIAKYKIDLTGYDNIQEVRKAIKRHQNRERRSKTILTPKQEINKPPPPTKSNTLTQLKVDWVNDITNKTMLNVHKYGLQLSDYKDKSELIKAIQRIKMKEYRQNKTSKKSAKGAPSCRVSDDEDEDSFVVEDAHLDFQRRLTGKPELQYQGRDILYEEDDEDDD